MPETQEPFIHENGKTLPRRPRPGELTSHRLGGLVNELGRLRQAAGQGDPRLADARREPYDLAIGVIAMLREPGFNSAAIAFAALPPADAAILSDVAAALLDAGTKRPKLLLQLRAAMESLS